jgi:hypothetical protein
LTQWQIGPRPGEHYLWTGGWEKRMLDLVELSTADVINTLCAGNAGGGSPDRPPILRSEPRAGGGPQAHRSKSRPAFERVQRIIDELYPTGVPDQASEPNANLCRRVATKLKDAKLPAVSDDTILRAAGRRK